MGRSPARPRPPGQRPATVDKLLAQGSTLILAAMAAVVLLAVGISLVAIRGSDGTDDRAGEPIELPLNLATVGFGGDGTVEATSVDEGPAATSYCNNAPAATGLLDWRGNRLTEGNGQRRVAQLVARFETSFDATAYLEATSATIDCGSWTTVAGDEELEFTVTEQAPARSLGDETRQFDLQASSAGPDLYLRTLLTRSGELVAQFTFISADPDDLDEVNRLAQAGTLALGY